MSDTIQAPAMPTMTLTMTAKAAEKIRGLLQAQGKSPDEFALRVGVQAGGCSGLSYVFNLDQTKPNDILVARDGARMACDPKSILYLGGSELEYLDTLTGAGFVWRNPNVKGTCGCGTSFNI